MAEHPLKGSIKFVELGPNKISIEKVNFGPNRQGVDLSISSDIEIKSSILLTKDEALKLAAQLMCAFNYDED